MYYKQIRIPASYASLFFVALAIFVSLIIQENLQLKTLAGLKKQNEIAVQLVDIISTNNMKYPFGMHLQYWSPANPLFPYMLKVWSSKEINLNVGQEVVIKKPFIQEPKSALSSYFKKEKILAHVFVKEVDVIRTTENFSWIKNTIFKWRKNIHSFVTQGLNAKTKALMESLFFGLKNSDSVDYKPWQYWGISHYLARSGLHVVVLLALLLPLLMLLPISVFWRSAISIFLLMVYHLISWSSVSFMRAIFMFMFGQICFMNYFPVKTTHVVLLTATLFLIINPYYLLFADFQLSFGLTFALAIFLEYSRMNAATARQESIAS